MLAPRLAFLAVVCVQIVHATAWGKESLKGLTVFSVSVVVEPACTRVVTADRIQTDVELKLRSAGLPLKQRAQMEDGGAAIDVSVACLPIINGGRTIAWAVAYTLAVMQMVDLRTTRTSALAETWSIDSTIVDSPSSIENHTRNWIRDSTDEFLNDYFTANPKK
jgi:hypothetical protein